MLITLSFDKFASHFCRTLKLRVMNQNSGVGNSRSISFYGVLFNSSTLRNLEHFGNRKNEKLISEQIFVGQVHNILFITNVCVYRNNGGI